MTNRLYIYLVINYIFANFVASNIMYHFNINHMKSYFVFITSKDFPREACTANFSKFNEAHEYLMRKLWTLQALMDFDCRVIHKVTQTEQYKYRITNESVYPKRGEAKAAKNIYLQIHKTNLYDADHA